MKRKGIQSSSLERSRSFAFFILFLFTTPGRLRFTQPQFTNKNPSMGRQFTKSHTGITVHKNSKSYEFSKLKPPNCQEQLLNTSARDKIQTEAKNNTSNQHRSMQATLFLKIVTRGITQKWRHKDIHKRRGVK